MAWSESDLISFLELNPELKEILNSKLDKNEYDIALANLQEDISNLNTKLTNHINDKVVHITAAERTYWNSIEAKLKTYVDNASSRSSGEISTLEDTVNAHIANTVVHITKEERDKWNSAQQNAITTSNTYTDEKVAYLRGLIQTTGETIDDTAEALYATMNNHINNKDIHVTLADKSNWNSIYKKATDYSDSRLNTRATPIEDSLSNHIGNSTIHVTTTDKAKWNVAESNSNKYTDNRIATLKSDVDNSVNALNLMDTALNNKIDALSSDTNGKVSNLQSTDNNLLQMIRALDVEPITTNGGIRLSIQGDAPGSPRVNRELWLNLSNGLMYYYSSGGWAIVKTIYS